MAFFFTDEAINVNAFTDETVLRGRLLPLMRSQGCVHMRHLVSFASQPLSGRRGVFQGMPFCTRYLRRRDDDLRRKLSFKSGSYAGIARYS